MKPKKSFDVCHVMAAGKDLIINQCVFFWLASLYSNKIQGNINIDW